MLSAVLAAGCGGDALVGKRAADAGSDPLNAAAVCTSGQMWTGGNRADENMQPGEPCNACHIGPGRGGPPLAYGGTVYPTGHEPSQCYGANGRNDVFGAEVVITDGTGATHTAPVNAVGNFYLEADDPLPPPIRAKVVWNGRERAMVTPAATADCNLCHTQAGTTTATDPNAPRAPGRITLP